MNQCCGLTWRLHLVNTAYAGTVTFWPMKFEEVFSTEHLMECAKACLTGVTWKASAQMFEINLLQWVASLHRDLLSGDYRSRGFNTFTLCERGKRRLISAVYISERCVQKCLVRYALKPVILPRIIYDNAATIEGRGTEFAVKRLREHLRWHLARYGRTGGILTADYTNYFGCIVHEYLLNMIRPYIDDDRVFDLIAYFIDCFPGDRGLGLGSEISQICAVFYTNGIDHYFKDRLGVHGYAKYMDDSYAISEDLGRLKEYQEIVNEKSAELGLEINSKMTQITKFDGGSFIYLKKRVFITEKNRIVMRLTPKNITQRRQKINRQNTLISEGRMTPESQRQSFVSWRGYAEKYDSHRSVENLERMLIQEEV